MSFSNVLIFVGLDIAFDATLEQIPSHGFCQKSIIKGVLGNANLAFILLSEQLFIVYELVFTLKFCSIC